MHFLERDIYALVKTFFDSGSRIFVLDPGNIIIKNYPCEFEYITTRNEVETLSELKVRFILVNLTGARVFSFPLDFKLADGILSFSPSHESATGFFHYELFYINDVRDQLRLLFSANHRINDFMDDLEESSSMIDVNNLMNLYPYIINYIRLKTGHIGKITDGNFHIYKNSANLIPDIDDSYYESFSVNLHKNIHSGFLFFRLYAQKQWKAILKYAFNDSGNNYVNAEYLVLSKLEKQKGTGLIPDEIKKTGKSLLFMLSNTKRELDYHLTSHSLDKIILGLNDLIPAFKNEMTTREFLQKENLFTILKVLNLAVEKKLIPRGLSHTNLSNMLNMNLSLLNNIDLEYKIIVSLATRAISPENLLLSDNRVILYNWASSTFNLPLLFDLFNYLFLYVENFENPEPEMLIKKINRIRNSGILNGVIDKYGIDFFLNLKLYIIHRSVLETSAIIDKPLVRPEINIKILFWIETAQSLF